MATQDGKFLRGVLGGLIFKIVNGKQVISTRVAPGTMKQNAAMKRSSNTFGMAASLSAAIRNTLSVQINRFNDGTAVSRLTGEISKMLGNIRNPESMLYSFESGSFKNLVGFEFNQLSKVKDRVAALPAVNLTDGILNVKIHELSIPRELKFPAGSFQCKLSICVSLFRLNDGLAAELPDVKTVVVTKDKDRLLGQDFQFEVPAGCLCITSLFMEYAAAGKNGWEVLNNKKLNPGCICATVIRPGSYQQQDKRTWIAMVSFDESKEDKWADNK
jgi:hypothetical protein